MDFTTNDYSLQLAVTDYVNEDTNKKPHTVTLLVNTISRQLLQINDFFSVLRYRD